MGLDVLEDRRLLSYSIDSLGTAYLSDPTDFTLGTVALNASGEVAGTGINNHVDEAYYLNKDGQLIWLAPLSGGLSSAALALNGAGEVAGYSTVGGQSGIGGLVSSVQAVVWDSQGQATGLGDLGGGFSEATGINDAGQIVGYSESNASGSPNHAFLYDRGGSLIDLGTLGGSDSYATGINDAGQIVGYSATGTSSDSPDHAFLLTGSGPLSSADDLGVPAGYTSSYATAVNDSGQVVGCAARTVTDQSGNTSTVIEPFLYSDGQWTDLGNLGGTNAEAKAINDAGDVVGYSAAPPPDYSGGPIPIHAFLYTKSTGIQDLNTLIDAGTPWMLANATGINSKGEISGVGSNDAYANGFLLFPQNSPPTTSAPSPTPTSGTTSPLTPAPNPTLPPSHPGLTPPPAAAPGGPAAGSFRTRTILSARPRPAKVGRPVNLTATVKVLGHVRGVPPGSVEFLDGSTILGTVPLDGHRATLRLLGLPGGRHAIRVEYVGAGGFVASTSRTVIENVKAPRSRPKIVLAPIRPMSGSSGPAFGEPDGPGGRGPGPAPVPQSRDASTNRTRMTGSRSTLT